MGIYIDMKFFHGALPNKKEVTASLAACCGKLGQEQCDHTEPNCSAGDGARGRSRAHRVSPQTAGSLRGRKTLESERRRSADAGS